MPSPSADRRRRATCSASSVTWPPRARSVSNRPSPSWKPRSNADRCSPSAANSSPLTQTWRGPAPATLTATGPRPPRSRTAAHAPWPRSRPTPPRVAAPGDPAADVERQPLAVGDERPNEDARPHPPVGPEPQQRPAIWPAPDGLQPLDQLHRPDLRGARDAAAGEGGSEQVEGIGVGTEPAGDGRHEVLDGGRPLEPQQPRHADRARLADPAEVVAEHVDDHHVLGLVLRARQQLAGEGAVLLARPASGAGALDRVGRDVALAVDRQERLRRRRQQRARAAGRGRGTEVEIAGEQRRVTGPEAPEHGPRVAVERGLEPAGQVRLVDVAAPDGVTDGLDVDAARRRAPSGTGRPPARLPRRRRWSSQLRRGRTPRPSSAPPRDADRAVRHRHRPSAPPATPGPCGGPRPASSHGGRAAAPAGAGRPGRSTAAARTGVRGRSPGSRPGRHRTGVMALGRVATPGASAVAPGAAPSRARASANGSGPSAGASTTATGSAVR